MNEWTQVWFTPLRIAIVAVFALCYVIGGRKWKWMRRFVGGAWIAGASIGLSSLLGTFSWWLFASIPIYFLGLSFGYGGNTFAKKFWRRLLAGFMLGAASFSLSLWTGLWIVSLYQTILAISAHLFFGLINPYNDAVKEEGTIATLGTCLTPFLV